jgi:hypothetical protein
MRPWQSSKADQRDTPETSVAGPAGAHCTLSRTAEAARTDPLPLAISRACPTVDGQRGIRVMLNDREKILTALREKPLKIYEIMKRANLPNEEACQSLLMKMRGEGSVKFDIHKGRWLIG